MRTLGIDLAAQPVRTAACSIDWAATPAICVHHDEPLDDDALIRLATADGLAKVGIDAPFGWPEAFVGAVTAHATANDWPAHWRDADEFVFRATDLVVREEVRQRPLSVSASLLAIPAMRCASLLSRIERRHPVDRSGSGLTVEVYPAAALRRWNLSPAAWAHNPGSYKGNGQGRRERRRRLVDELAAELQGVVAVAPSDAGRMEASDDHLDAFLCALVARAAHLGHTDPPGEHQEKARVEGWIALPSRPPADLRGG